MNTEQLAAAKKILAANPNQKEAFVTKDGQVFFSENHAQNHARSLGKADEYDKVEKELKADAHAKVDEKKKK